MSDQSISVAVIIGSTRDGRFAPTVASWFMEQATARPNLEVDVIDLVDAKLPSTLCAEPPDAVMALIPRLADADAFVVVTPEYNHSYPAALKTLVDWYYVEWQAKPVAFVSYGGQSGGLRAVEHLRQVFSEVHAVPIRDVVSFHAAHDQFDATGAPVDPEGTGAAAAVLLDKLIWWALAMRDAKAVRPFKV